MTTGVGHPAPPGVEPSLPYHPPGWASARPLERVAATLIESGAIRPGEPDPIPLVPPFPWNPDDEATPPADLASWSFLDPLLETYSTSGEFRYLEPAFDLARDWARSHRTTTTAGPTEIIASRAWRLAYILAEAERHGGFGPSELKTLRDVATTYEAHLATTPGVPAACGRLALSARLDAPGREAVTEAQAAATDAFVGAFDIDGVHISRNPATHNRDLGLLSAVLASRMVTGSDLTELRERAEEALSWFVLPDGSLATFGDTGEEFISPAWSGPQIALRFVQDRYRTETLRHLASLGRLGTPPQHDTRAFPDAGFLVMRPARPFAADGDPEASYVALQAGSIGTHHPQRDDLAVVWFDRGRNILINAGTRPPAPPDAAAVQYLVSPRAHNTVTIDGRRPTSEAELERWGEVRGIMFADARAEIDTVTHRRSIMTKPNQWLLVIDTLYDGAGAAHRYRQWFHAAEDLGLVKDGRRYMLTDSGTPSVFALPLRGTQEPLTPLRCKTSPHLRGWWAPQPGVLVPNWSFGWEANGARATLATLFTFDRPAHPLERPEGTLAWTRSGVETVVTLRDIGLVDVREQATTTTTENS